MISSSGFRTLFKSSSSTAATATAGFQLALKSLTELSAENSEEGSQSTISENIEEEEVEEGEEQEQEGGGTGSVSSGSAKSVSTHRSESRLDESLSGSSFPNSPVQNYHHHHHHHHGFQDTTQKGSNSKHGQRSNRSRSEESNGQPSNHKPGIPKSRGDGRRRSRTETDLKHAMPLLNNRKYNDYDPDDGGGNAIELKDSRSRGSDHGRLESSELPRLIGTKSQASTASSSATRDSGISLTDLQGNRRMPKGGNGSRSSTKPKIQNHGGSQQQQPQQLQQQQISVDDLPVNGHAVSLANRKPGTNSREQESQKTYSRLSSKYQNQRQPQYDDDWQRGEYDDIDAEIIEDVTPPRSPRYPHNPSHGSGDSRSSLLMRPAENSPFSNNRMSRLDASSNSTPSSQPLSCYDYEDDFTSDSEDEAMANNRSAQSQRTTISNASSISQSRIPIQRHSSLRRKKDIMENYRNGMSSEPTSKPSSVDTISRPVREPAVKKTYLKKKETSPMTPQQQPRRTASQKKPIFQKEKIPPSKSLDRLNKSPSKARAAAAEPEKKATPMEGKGSSSSRMTKGHSKSVGAINRAVEDDETAPLNNEEEDDPFRASHNLCNSPIERSRSPAAAATQSRTPSPSPPPLPSRPTVTKAKPQPRKKRNPAKAPATARAPPVLPPEEEPPPPPEEPSPPPPPPASEEPRLPPATLSTPPLDQLSTSTQSRLSTAHSVISNVNYSGIQLKTQVTLKSPFEGTNLCPSPMKPEEFLAKNMEEMQSDNWEANVKGMSGIVRMTRHHTDFIILHYKEVMNLLMKHVKNLRSQVCRAAVIVVSEMFQTLKRSMESDLEKLVVPLVLKTADTNKFLREDCQVALDSMVENLSPARVVSVITSDEMLNHKNPTIRATISRLIAYSVERMTVHKVLSGAKDITEKILPAVAKLAQDGSQDARSFAKLTLVMFIEQAPDTYEKALKKNLTQNTMRNLDKLIQALKQPPRSGRPGRPGRGGGLSSRKAGGRANSRKTL